MALRVPPPEIPVISWLSPNKADQGLLEFWNTELASYTPLDVGAPHPNQRQYAGFRLGKQAPVQGDEKWTLRIWVSDETSPDWWNYAQKYSGEDNAFPIFIRTYREPRATYTPRVKGTPLGTLYKTVMTNVGSGYANGAYPTVEFDVPTVEATTEAIGHGVVSADGSITEVVLDFGGEGYTQDVEFRVARPITGDQATGIAYVQPQIAILVREEANLYPPDSEFYAQYLQVTRVYETIPGPTFYGTTLDIDGATLTTATTRKLCEDIVTGEDIDAGVWCKTTKKPTDIDVICEEVVACRPIPGNTMESTKIDVDGKVITRQQTYVATSSIISSETIATGNWIKKYQEDVEGTDLVSWQIVESRPIPGNPLVSTKIAEDGVPIAVTKVLGDTSLIVSEEIIDSGFWIKTYKEEVSDLVAYQVQEVRAIPGNPVVTTKVDEDGETITITKVLGDTSLIVTSEVITLGNWIRTYKEPVSDLVANQVQEVRVVPGNPIAEDKIDEDGKPIETVRTLKDATTITPSETITAGVWIKTESKSVTDLVSWEIVTSKDLPGNSISSATIDGDQEVNNISQVMRDENLITPSSSEAGGFITKVEKQAVSDLVANQITTVTRWLDKAFYSQRIPDSVIPIEFRAAIPTVTESHILAGTASAAGATLSGSQIFVAEQQLTKNLYEHRTEDFGSLGFPIIQTNYETTEEYGGGILEVIRTLNDSVLTVDQGESVVRSEVREIGQSYLWFKETASRFGAAAWPILTGTEVDPRTGISIAVIKQVVDAGTTGGISGSDYIDVKSIDKWRSIQITSRLDPDSLPGTVQWKTTDSYPFPNTLQGATWLWGLATDDCCYSFDLALELDMDEGYSGPCVAQITESFTNGPPLDTPVLTQFFPKAHMLGYAWAVTSPDPDCRLCQAQARTFSIPPSIHEEITIAGSVILDNGTFTSTLAATTPTALPAPGTLITKSVDVERWRFGVFFKRVTEIYVPG